MDRIGLLTFHRTTNFGSYLQTYGLFREIRNLGFDCEIIDYRCPSIEERENLQKMVGHNVKSILKALLLQPAYNKKAAALEDFSTHNMTFSKPFVPDNIEDANDLYDRFIVGSDIVWGLDITDCDYNFFLKFAADEKKKFAFSSSVGTETMEHKDEVKPLLRRFDRIAVREYSAVEWVKKVSNCNADWVCDPTMLLTVNEWRSAIPFEQIEKDYVLIYFNNPGKKALRDAIEFANKYHKKVLYVNHGLPEKGVVNIKPKSLNEFLSLICYADHIFTASYHGMLFSLYFNKEMTFYTRDHASRMISLAERLGIQGQCGDSSTIENFQCMSYKAINERIDEFRNASINILKEMLVS
ncbi:MAG: polysaccharide pyruvyl transferase family protein [Clostridia bacterium]|nr:polysaccharide pyruvyl transferase family protein [Clostridia bacterium]